MGTVKELMFSPRLDLMPNFPKTILLKDLNEFITCKICGGYLIDATTITECLHTFCKSCIVKHLEDENSCPNCDSQIHHSYPLNYIAHDRTMQDIVYKLVPQLLEDELERERKFYQDRGLPNPKDEKPDDEEDEKDDDDNDEDDDGEEDEEKGAKEEKKTKTSEEADEEGKAHPDKEKKMCNHHHEDEQVNICLEPDEAADLDPLKKKFIRVSTQATITHVKKFVALKLWNDAARFKELDVMCNGVLCGKDHTLKFVVISNWKCEAYPMLLRYRPRLEFY